MDYEKTLGQQYEEIKQNKQYKLPILQQTQFDSVIEKCEYAIQDMHRPIVKSKTADYAIIISSSGSLNAIFNQVSYEYIKYTEQSANPELVQGKVSSYNINTFKGRIFVFDEKRPISFTLSNKARTSSCIDEIMINMSMNARDLFSNEGENKGKVIIFNVYKNMSGSGRLKSYTVLDVYPDF